MTAYVDQALGSSSGRDASPTHPAVLPVTKLSAVPAVENLLSVVPFISGYLIPIADEVCVWYFSTLAGGGKPRVRAGDGAVWPYPRKR